MLQAMGRWDDNDDHNDDDDAGSASSEVGADDRPPMDRDAEDGAPFPTLEAVYRTGPRENDDWAHRRCRLRRRRPVYWKRTVADLSRMRRQVR